jgi:hypothetical protein
MYQLNGKQDELCSGERSPRRAGFGASPKPTWHGTGGPHSLGKKKMCDDEGVIASTRGACAPQMRASRDDFYTSKRIQAARSILIYSDTCVRFA